MSLDLYILFLFLTCEFWFHIQLIRNKPVQSYWVSQCLFKVNNKITKLMSMDFSTVFSVDFVHVFVHLI